MNNSKELQDSNISKQKEKMQIVWRNVFGMTMYHLLALHGLIFILTFRTYWKTTVYGKFDQSVDSD